MQNIKTLFFVFYSLPFV